MSATIEKITIRLGKRSIDLTPDEARELRDVLEDVLAPKAKEPVFPNFPMPPRPIPPELPEFFRHPFDHRRHQITCNATTGREEWLEQISAHSA